MWYVIQVVGGREESMLKKIERLVRRELFDKCFIPKYEVSEKRGGEWVVRRKVLFPGYVFVDTRDPKGFNAALKDVRGMTRLLASGDAESGRRFIQISDDEKALICAFTGESHVMRMSEGVIEGDEVRIVNGPLCGCEAMVVKIDRHKRLAWLDAEMFGRHLKLKVGLEVVRKS